MYASLSHFKPILLKNFRQKENAQLLEKLKYELRKELTAPQQPPSPQRGNATIAAKLPDGTQKDNAATTSAPEVVPLLGAEGAKDPKQTVLFHQLPAELRPVLLEAHTLFRENCLLKVQLNELAADQENEALQLQVKIFNNFARNAHCWKQIDYWREHKALAPSAPQGGTFAALTPEQRVKRQAQLWSSISKLKKRLDSNEDALAAATTVKDKTRLEKNVAKQKANILKQEGQLIEITKIIDGHE